MHVHVHCNVSALVKSTRVFKMTTSYQACRACISSHFRHVVRRLSCVCDKQPGLFSEFRNTLAGSKAVLSARYVYTCMHVCTYAKHVWEFVNNHACTHECMYARMNRIMSVNLYQPRNCFCFLYTLSDYTGDSSICTSAPFKE